MKFIKNILSYLLISVLLYSPVILNTAYAEQDTRQTINLTEDERNLVLAEMRTFLDTVRMVTVALAQNDYAAINLSAKKVGMTAAGQVPPELSNKLPAQFKQLAMRVHQSFDLIALDAEALEDKQQTLEQLGALMGNCVSCHAIFKLEASTE